MASALIQPLAGNFYMPQVWPYKGKSKKERQEERRRGRKEGRKEGRTERQAQINKLEKVEAKNVHILSTWG